jgi:ribosomal protein S18 acetylase RimI-like enzyme
MKIRKGKLNDLEEIYKILNETPELSGSRQKGESYTKKEIKIALKDKNHLALIADDNNKLAGFLIAEILKKKEMSYLVDIYVKPGYRKMGIASKFINEYEKTCREFKIREILTLVLKSNEKMKLFMEKNKYLEGKECIQFDKRLK